MNILRQAEQKQKKSELLHAILYSTMPLLIQNFSFFLNSTKLYVYCLFFLTAFFFIFKK